MTEHRILDRPGGTFDELLEALKRPSGDGGSGGRRGGGGNDGGEGGGDDGDRRFRAFAELLIDALRRIGDVQLKAVEGMTARVGEMAVRGDELVAATMAAAMARAIDHSAEIAAHVGDLAQRVRALEAEVGAIKSAAEKKATLQ